MTATPTLGYPSRREAVLALRGQGLSRREVARRIGIAASTVHAHEQVAALPRRVPEELRYRPTVLLSPALVERLRPHAERRSMRPEDLARLLLTIVAEEAMVDAVLDDAPPAGGAA